MMALIKCPECGKEVSDSAIACPSCGFPVKDCTYDIIVTDIGTNEKLALSTMAKIIGGELPDTSAAKAAANLPCTIIQSTSKEMRDEAMIEFNRAGISYEIKPNKALMNQHFIRPNLIAFLGYIVFVIGVLCAIMMIAVELNYTDDIATLILSNVGLVVECGIVCVVFMTLAQIIDLLGQHSKR